MISGTAIAILLGIWNSLVLNLAQAMERHGIVIFDRKSPDLPSDSGKGRKPLIYIIGFILNQTPPLWTIISNKYAPTSYFTSMFGVGLILVLFYSAIFLNEKITKRKIIGAAILISGTILLGIDGILRPHLDFSEINITISSIFIATLFLISISLVIVLRKKGSKFVIGITFGLICGSFGSIDPVLKGIGQNFGGTDGLFPSNPIGWVIFIVSFASSFFSFTLGQYGFSKKTDASVQLPAYNSAFILAPIIIQAIALPGFNITLLTIIGIVIVISGILLMQVKTATIVEKN